MIDKKSRVTPSLVLNLVIDALDADIKSLSTRGKPSVSKYKKLKEVANINREIIEKIIDKELIKNTKEYGTGSEKTKEMILLIAIINTKNLILEFFICNHVNDD